MNTNEQAPECCPFCGAGIRIEKDGSQCRAPRGTWVGFNCRTTWHQGYHDQRRLQSLPCTLAERERLIRERDVFAMQANTLAVKVYQLTSKLNQATLELDQALMLLGVYKTKSGDLLARVKHLESDWAGWPELQREWFGGKYAAMQPWDAVRARIEDTEARVQRLEEALEACAAIIGPRDKVTWATDEQVDHAWELYTKAKEAKP